jgi:hypothetical protein
MKRFVIFIARSITNYPSFGQFFLNIPFFRMLRTLNVVRKPSGLFAVMSELPEDLIPIDALLHPQKIDFII